ncbi:thioredoxin [Methylocystis sp. MJC1]|jgi:putative thioredoxin|uniref:thioredoxin n=1 Tax=Methylocystis sp. MJC1 TaxID=2654282 RepID=UPI0013EBD766|nr:thioredoxin [Methylocystis sp. MJC1]KAF2992767.1 Thioredoxin [Methylocystis sp. MJC1]MBU6526729.1 thioredoxin [Methylocystis sp. MJC1]UZX13166.1 thioredoxin [Methylocystis sp. MJC1]
MVEFANKAAEATGPIETTVARFRMDVLEASLRKVVLVDFWAPWCGPCKQLAPILERLVAATGGKVQLAKMNIDAEPEIADQLGIKSIPAVVAFQRGRPVDGFVGALPESQIKGFLERLVGPIEDAADAMEAVQEMIEAGDVASAHALLSELTSQEPVNPKAFAMLARLYTAAGQLDEARAVLERLPESTRKDVDVAAAAAAIENATAAQDLGEIEDLKNRINFDPNDLQAYFDLALALNAKDRREEAANALLEIIRRDRSWNDDGARKQLVQFFEAWGPMDKAAVAARRRLSTLLFS